MWFYMMAFMFTSVVEQDFFRHKACRVDHGYSEEICLKLNDDNNKAIKTEVQVKITIYYIKEKKKKQKAGRGKNIILKYRTIIVLTTHQIIKFDLSRFITFGNHLENLRYLI